MAIPQPTIVGEAVGLIFVYAPEDQTAPILNLPDGTLKVRRRFRPGHFPRAFVRTSHSTQTFLLKRVEGGLELCFEQGVNIREAA